MFACSEPPAEVAPSSGPASDATSTEPPIVTVGPGATSPLEGCPVTRPGPSSTVPEAASELILDGSSNPELARARLSMHGNDAIWVVIPAGGVAQLDVKLGTVRLIPGALSASARRLDGPARPAEFVIPDGYGPIGFQAFGIRFSEVGCWEVTQRVAAKELRFTLWVEG